MCIAERFRVPPEPGAVQKRLVDVSPIYRVEVMVISMANTQDYDE